MEDEKMIIEEFKKSTKKTLPKLNDNALEEATLFGEGMVIANAIEDRSEQDVGE